MEGVWAGFSGSVTLRARPSTLGASAADSPLPEDSLKHDAGLGQLPATVVALLGVV